MCSKSSVFRSSLDWVLCFPLCSYYQLDLQLGSTKLLINIENKFKIIVTDSTCRAKSHVANSGQTQAFVADGGSQVHILLAQWTRTLIPPRDMKLLASAELMQVQFSSSDLSALRFLSWFQSFFDWGKESCEWRTLEREKQVDKQETERGQGKPEEKESGEKIKYKNRDGENGFYIRWGLCRVLQNPNCISLG